MAMNENIELMMPIKAAPYDHQKKAFAFACDKFGVFDERLKHAHLGGSWGGFGRGLGEKPMQR